MSKKQGKDLEALYLQTLAQSVAEREHDINEYACNIYADKIAQINILMDILDKEEDRETLQELASLKQVYKKLGTALWFMQAGELTNLGARLGSTIKQYKVREE
ncbi:MAG: hypothetical protein NO515_05335 [Candidatus Methanomethylicia archaeon]|nr:hypothetical protein [Candidatus Methanomethylicia archaeon]